MKILIDNPKKVVTMNSSNEEWSGGHILVENDKIVSLGKEKYTGEFDKKIDVKKLQYGSKIDENSGKRDRYYLVKNVISPEKVELSNGIRFRMKGVKEDVVKNGTALKFLNDLVKGKRVFLKFDGEKYDLSQNLCGYLYLQNKTFVNAHLIKNHLVKPDTESEYRYKKKFLRLSAE